MKTRTKKSILALFAAISLAIPSVFAAAPTNVTGVSAVATGPSSISISWNSAQSGTGGLVDHYRIYYSTKSVQGGEAFSYENDVDTPNNSTSYSLMGLTADTTYYFSVTAIDGSGVESDEYSVETNATTQTSGPSDSIPPIVMSVVSLDSTHVTVKFSEKVVLPQLLPEAAFSISEQITPSNSLEVTNAVLYLSADPSGKIVLLETAEQVKNMNYVVTASVAITDIAGNPIVSGSTDSGLFAGTDKATAVVSMAQEAGTEAPVEEDDEDPQAQQNGDNGDDEDAQANEDNQETNGEIFVPNIDQPENTQPVNMDAANCGHADTTNPLGDAGSVIGCFEAKFQTCQPAVFTKLVKEDDKEVTYQYEIIAEAGEDCQVSTKVLEHDDDNWVEKAMTCSYDNSKSFDESNKEVLGSFSLTEKLGSCSGELYALMTAGQSEVVVDTTPPEDITSLALTFKQQVDSFMILLNWTASVNSAKDLVDQILYQSLDRGASYDKGKSLGASVTSTSVNNLEAGKEYTFKVTTKDAAGNESVGAVRSIRLPQTGVGVGLLLFGSAFGAKAALKRKRKK